MKIHINILFILNEYHSIEIHESIRETHNPKKSLTSSVYKETEKVISKKCL